MTVAEILRKLESLGSPENVAGMKRYAIVAPSVFGISAPVLKQLARDIKKQAHDRHVLAQQLWDTGNYEARVIAFLIDDPRRVTPEQMENWAADFDNWATVDGTCSYLFCRTPYAYAKAFEWADRDEEFVKRAAFSLIAYLTVHDKKAEDEKLAAFLPVIEAHSDDERNFVKKAVNWALRQIGKRSMYLNKLAIDTGERIKAQNSKPARWIASDALRELRSEAVLARIQARG
jgi:3-methyladenine DNA glycosylase AlkD